MTCDKDLNIVEFNGIRSIFVEDIEECKKCPEFQGDFCDHWCCQVYES